MGRKKNGEKKNLFHGAQNELSVIGLKQFYCSDLAGWIKKEVSNGL